MVSASGRSDQQHHRHAEQMRPERREQLVRRLVARDQGDDAPDEDRDRRVEQRDRRSRPRTAPMNRPFAWRAKCQKKATKPGGGCGLLRQIGRLQQPLEAAKTWHGLKTGARPPATPSLAPSSGATPIPVYRIGWRRVEKLRVGTMTRRCAQFQRCVKRAFATAAAIPGRRAGLQTVPKFGSSGSLGRGDPQNPARWRCRSPATARRPGPARTSRMRSLQLASAGAPRWRPFRRRARAAPRVLPASAPTNRLPRQAWETGRRA